MLKFIKYALNNCGAVICKICGASHRRCTSTNGVCQSCVAKGLK